MQGGEPLLDQRKYTDRAGDGCAAKIMRMIGIFGEKNVLSGLFEYLLP
jgi:hypothetical protein